MRLRNAINEAFVKYGSNNAISVFSPIGTVETLTYKELKELVDDFSVYMLSDGLCDNDFVLAYMNKSPMLAVVILSSMLCGTVVSSLNNRLKHDQVAKIANKTNAKFVILDEITLLNFIKNDSEIKNKNRFIFFNKSGSNGRKNIFKKVENNINITEYSFFPNSHKKTLNTRNTISGKLPCYCLFTSGSTGEPKGVLISRDDFFERANTELEDYNLISDDRLLSLLPFSFDVGLNQFFSCFLAGGHLVILNSWFPKDILKAISKMQITGISGVPSVWLEMLSSQNISFPEEDLFSLKYITVSGGDLSKKYLLKLANYFQRTDIYKTYGQSETFRSGMLKPVDFTRKITSVGKPPKGVKVFILTKDGNVAEPNVNGEIVHCGAGTMIGYLGDDDETGKKIKAMANVFSGQSGDDNVVLTGDYGKIDDEGYLYVLGRKDGMIKTSGYRVYPKEVEDMILEHPDVKAVAVIGVPDKLRGQKILAELVVLNYINENDLFSFLKKRAPDYMIPWGIYFVDELPMTVNGKVKYQVIRDKYNHLA